MLTGIPLAMMTRRMVRRRMLRLRGAGTLPMLETVVILLSLAGVAAADLLAAPDKPMKQPKPGTGLDGPGRKHGLFRQMPGILHRIMACHCTCSRRFR
jgi:hypothetical protein